MFNDEKVLTIVTVHILKDKMVPVSLSLITVFLVQK